MNVSLYIVAFLSIGGFLAVLQSIHNFYVLYPIVAIIGSVPPVLIHNYNQKIWLSFFTSELKF